MNQANISRFSAPSAWSLSWQEAPFETFLLAGLLGGLAWAPFWLGGDRPLAWGVNGLWFPALTLSYEISLLIRGKKHPVAAKRIAGSVALFCLALAWIGVQMLQMPPNMPSGLSHPIWNMAGDALGTQLNAAISVNPQASALAMTRLLTDAAVLWLSIQLCRSPRYAIMLLEAVVVIVAAYSAYGILLSMLAGGTIPFFDTPGGGLIVRSTFVNQNNFATYAGMGLVCACALILRLYRHEVPNAEGVGAFRLSKFIEATGQHGWKLLSAALVIFVALLGTVSRGGILATALGLFVFFSLSFVQREHRGGQKIETILFVVVVMLAGSLLFGDRIAGRISETGLTDAGRLAVYVIILHSLFDTMYIGFGYGTFADVFPMYRDQSISTSGVWDMAHNSYLEVLKG